MGDVSQFSAEKGRKPIEQQVIELTRERKVLKDRLLYLRGLLSNKKIQYGRNAPARQINTERTEIINEILEIEKQLAKTKGPLHKLNQLTENTQINLLVQIRDLLITITEQTAKK